MKPAQHNFDPQLYSYGGLWVYPVGALLKLAGSVGLVHLTSDVAWYLDRPEAFGRFYVVARIYSAIWGLVGIVAVFSLIGRIGGSMIASAVGSLCFSLLPIIVNAAHEAKPHLAGAALILLTVLAASIYSESGRRTCRLAAAVLAGLAVGMIPTSVPVLIVLGVMECLSEWPSEKAAIFRCIGRTAGSLAIAVLIYCITNPYVVIDLLWNQTPLKVDFNRSSGGLSASWKGLPNALLVAGLIIFCYRWSGYRRNCRYSKTSFVNFGINSASIKYTAKPHIFC